MWKVGLVYLVLFSCLTLFVHTVTIQTWDEWITDKVVATRSVLKNKIMLFFTKLGRIYGIIVLILLLTTIPSFRMYVIPMAGVSLGGSWGLAYLIKR